MKWVCYVLLCYWCVLECFAMSLSEIEDFSNYLKESSNLDQHVKSYPPEDGYEEDENISDYAWETSGKFEGDLILNERQRKMILSNVVEGLARNGLTDSTKRWPNNELIYFINAEHFSSDQLQSIQDGIDTLAGASCVKFRPYQQGDRDAVVIQGSSRGCFSQVGYQGGYQILNLDRRHPAGRGCFRQGTVMHEHLHALGFYHMQSSPDRDEFVDVLWDNIIKRARHNFRKYNTYAVSDFGVGYDYMSVLHYSRKAFSSNGQDTLVPKNGADIGQRTGLSEKDIIKLNKMYCDADSNLFTEDGDASYAEKRRKGTKNKPFVGHGLGYQKGKTVVIKLPKDDDKSRDLSKIDYFSKTTESMPSAIFKETEPREEIALYNYQFPKTNLNEYDIKALVKKYPKELKIIETKNDDKRVPQVINAGLYENIYRNINIPNDELRKDSNNKEIIGLLPSPVIFEEGIGNDKNIETVYEYDGHLSHVPASTNKNKNNVKLSMSEPIKHSDYPVTQYDSIVLYQPNRSSEKEKDFLFTNSKYDSPPTIGYESLGDFTDSKWHSNKNYKPDLYIQERPTEHEMFELPEIRYSY